MARELFARSLPSREWPTWARYLCTAIIVSLMLLLRLGLNPYLEGYPVLLFFAGIIVSAALFDHGSGIFAVLLSAAYAAYFLLPPVQSFFIAETSDLVGLCLFVIIGLSTATIIEALHKALFRLAVANEELKGANALLGEGDRDKDLLLQEAAHRIKNDLMTMASLVEMQAKLIQDPEARAALSSTVERINVLAQLHELLRRSENAAKVDTKALLMAIGDNVQGLLQLRPITVIVDAEPHELPQQRALSVGLIANELMTNCVKYAFPDDRAGTITTTFAKDGDAFSLRVADDGVGMAFSESRGTTGMGERLVRGLAAQLRGSYEQRPDSGEPGTVVTIRFPIAI